MRARHYETSAVVPAFAEQLFAHVDDPASLATHMQEASWRMGGGRMLGLPLWLEEQVILREAPLRKQWQTTAPPRLWVIGQYRMGLEITPAPYGSLLRVFIDYELPETLLTGWLGHLLGPYYARWCTRRMVDDAVKHFSTAPLSDPR